jgi:hypothetical protein
LYSEKPRRNFGFRPKNKPTARFAKITFIKNPQTIGSENLDLQQPSKSPGSPVFLSLRYPDRDWVAVNGSRSPTAAAFAKLASQGKPLEILLTDPFTMQKKTYKIINKNDRAEIEALAAHQNEDGPLASGSILDYVNTLARQINNYGFVILPSFSS